MAYLKKANDNKYYKRWGGKRIIVHGSGSRNLSNQSGNLDAWYSKHKKEKCHWTVIFLLYLKDLKSIYLSFLHVSVSSVLFTIAKYQQSVNSGINKENVVLMQNEILSSHKKWNCHLWKHGYNWR